MSNPFIAAVRSMIQALAALVVVAVANVAMSYLGVELDVAALSETLSLAAFGGLVWLFNAAGTRWPIVNTVLSLGFGTSPPAYEV